MRRFFWLSQTVVLMIAVSGHAAAFTITDFTANITVNTDGSYKVRESIRVDFTGEFRHGIFRDILVSQPDSFGSARRIRVDVAGVTDGFSKPRPYRSYKTGRFQRVKIGDPNVTVTGIQQYVITYTIRNGLLFFPDHDELYWNVTGTDWPVPIGRATCTVQLPSKTDLSKVQLASFQGAFGSSERAISTMTPQGPAFKTARPLNYNEGLTIAVGWPKGLVQAPSSAQKAGWFLADNLFAVFPLVVLGILVWVWKTHGKDPDVGLSVVVKYEPPDQLRPAEVGTLIDESADMLDITSTVVDLAVRGYLRIHETESEGWFKRPTFSLEKLPEPNEKDPRGGLSRYEETVYKKIFDFGDWVTSDDLKNRFYTSIPTIKRELYDAMMKKKLFTMRPDKVRDAYMGFGFFLIMASIFLTIFFAALLDSGRPFLAPGWGVSVGICGILLMVFSRLMPKKTAKGRKAHLEVKGFEEYLSRAEKLDLQLQEKKGIFEQYLPYAISLKVADQWAKAFEGIYTQPPDWYAGNWSSSGFHVRRFSNTLNSNLSQMGAAMASTPRSASAGGSGFGGGGSSGGGFGGGGGGSW